MITKRPPNVIYLGGGDGPGGEHGMTIENGYPATEAITPGYLVEITNASGAPRWQKHASSAGTFVQPAFALDEPFMGRGCDLDGADDYAAGDLVQVGIGHTGSKWWVVVPSGQNIVPGDKLESNGDGKFKEGTTYPILRALETTNGAVTEDTRVRAEVI